MDTYLDESGIVEAALYQCTDPDCQLISKGSELIPCIYQPDEFENVCHVRHCPQCRGKVELVSE